MIRNILLFLVISFYSTEGYLVQSAVAAPSILAPIETMGDISALSPAEMKRQVTQFINNFVEGLHPVLIVLFYAGLIFAAVIAFSLLVMFFFFIIMIFRR